MTRFRCATVAAATLAVGVAAGAAGLVGGDTFYVVDNINNGFFRSTTGDVGGDVLVAQLPDTFWADMSPADEDHHLFASDASRSH